MSCRSRSAKRFFTCLQKISADIFAWGRYLAARCRVFPTTADKEEQEEKEEKITTHATQRSFCYNNERKGASPRQIFHFLT